MSEYTIQLRPAPHCQVPDEVALRRLLKALLRSYGLVAVDVREVGDTAMRCIGCNNPMTWAESRVQYGRLLKRGIDEATAKQATPRCQKCMTVWIAANAPDAPDAADATEGGLGGTVGGADPRPIGSSREAG